MKKQTLSGWLCGFFGATFLLAIEMTFLAAAAGGAAVSTSSSVFFGSDAISTDPASHRTPMDPEVAPSFSLCSSKLAFR